MSTPEFQPRESPPESQPPSSFERSYCEQASFDAADFRLKRLAQNVPELGQEYGRVAAGAGNLIRDLQIDASFFDDPAKSLVFYSLALKKQRSNEASQAVDPDALEAEQRVVGIGAVLLAGEWSYRHNKLLNICPPELGLDEKDSITKVVAAIDKHGHVGLARAVQHYVDVSGVLHETKQRMGIDPAAKETNIEMHVVPLGAPSEATFEASGRLNGPVSYQHWAAGYEAAVAQFGSDSGSGAGAANMQGFALRRDNRRVVALSTVLSEALIRSMVSNQPMSRQAHDELLYANHTIRHEYVHTVGNARLNLFVGGSLEEMRAQWFSGDTECQMAYSKLGILFRGLKTLNESGVHIGGLYDYVRDTNAQGIGTNIYEAVANAYGLETMGEIALLHPSGGRTSGILEGALQGSLGGVNGVLARAAKNPNVNRGLASQRAIREYQEHCTLLANNPYIDSKTAQEMISFSHGPIFGALGIQ